MLQYGFGRPAPDRQTQLLLRREVADRHLLGMHEVEGRVRLILVGSTLSSQVKTCGRVQKEPLDPRKRRDLVLRKDEQQNRHAVNLTVQLLETILDPAPRSFYVRLWDGTC